MRLLFLLASLLVAAITVAQTQKASGATNGLAYVHPVFVLGGPYPQVIELIETGAQAKKAQGMMITKRQNTIHRHG